MDIAEVRFRAWYPRWPRVVPSGALETMNLELIPEDPAVSIDMDLMVKALGNLLQNAEEALPGAGIISVSAWWEDKWIVISVKDSGAGIASKDLPLIFDPFFTTKTHGSGLGLTTVNRIVSGHCGEVKIVSESGSGTEVKIYFPPFSNNRE